MKASVLLNSGPTVCSPTSACQHVSPSTSRREDTPETKKSPLECPLTKRHAVRSSSSSLLLLMCPSSTIISSGKVLKKKNKEFLLKQMKCESDTAAAVETFCSSCSRKHSRCGRNGASVQKKGSHLQNFSEKHIHSTSSSIFQSTKKEPHSFRFASTLPRSPSSCTPHLSSPGKKMRGSGPCKNTKSRPPRCDALLSSSTTANASCKGMGRVATKKKLTSAFQAPLKTVTSLRGPSARGGKGKNGEKNRRAITSSLPAQHQCAPSTPRQKSSPPSCDGVRLTNHHAVEAGVWRTPSPRCTTPPHHSFALSSSEPAWEWSPPPSLTLTSERAPPSLFRKETTPAPCIGTSLAKSDGMSCDPNAYERHSVLFHCPSPLPLTEKANAVMSTGNQRKTMGSAGVWRAPGSEREGKKKKKRRSDALDRLHDTTTEQEKGETDPFSRTNFRSPCASRSSEWDNTKRKSSHKKRRPATSHSWKTMAKLALASGVSGILKHSSFSPPSFSPACPLSRSLTVRPQEKMAKGDSKAASSLTSIPPGHQDESPAKPGGSLLLSSSSLREVVTKTTSTSPVSFPTPCSPSPSPSSPRRRVCIDPAVVRRDSIQSAWAVFWKALEKSYQIIETLPCTPRGVVRLVQPLWDMPIPSALPSWDPSSSLPYGLTQCSRPRDGVDNHNGRGEGGREMSTLAQPPPEARSCVWMGFCPTGTAMLRHPAKVVDMGEGCYSIRFQNGCVPMEVGSALRHPFPPAILAKSVSLGEIHRALCATIHWEGDGAVARYTKQAPWLMSPIQTMGSYMNSTAPFMYESHPRTQRCSAPPLFSGSAGNSRREGEYNEREVYSTVVVPHHNVGKVYDILTAPQVTGMADKMRSVHADRGVAHAPGSVAQPSVAAREVACFSPPNDAIRMECGAQKREWIPMPAALDGSSELPFGPLFLYLRCSEKGVSLAPRRGEYVSRAFDTEDTMFSHFSRQTFQSSVSNGFRDVVHSMNSGTAEWGQRVGMRVGTELQGIEDSACGIPSKHLTRGGWTLHELGNLLWQTICGLRHFHTTNHLIHGNLKPSNFILSPDDGHLVLTDIGVPFFPDAFVKAEVERIRFAKWDPLLSSSATGSLFHHPMKERNRARQEEAHPYLRPSFGAYFSASSSSGGGEIEEGKENVQQHQKGGWVFPPYLRIRSRRAFPPTEPPSSSSLPSGDTSCSQRRSTFSPEGSCSSCPSSFGISAEGSMDSSSASSMSFLTEEVQFLLHFVAPECLVEAEGHLWIDYTAQTPASDAYAVGMVFYWLYNGSFPSRKPSISKGIRFQGLLPSTLEAFAIPQGSGGEKALKVDKGFGENSCPALYVIDDPFSPLQTSTNSSSASFLGNKEVPQSKIVSDFTSKQKLMDIVLKDDGSLDFLLEQLLHSNPCERLLLEDARLLDFFCLYGAQRHELSAKKNERRQLVLMSEK